MSMTSGRPELGEIKVGDEVLVLRDGKNLTSIRSVVTKVARVWIDLEEIENASSRKRTWRMRKDTQDAGGSSFYRERFLTPEQHKWEWRLQEADAFLKYQGIEVHYARRWRAPEWRVALADLVRDYLKSIEKTEED